MWTPDLGNPELGAAWARTQRCQRWTELGVCSKLPPGQRGPLPRGPRKTSPSRDSPSPPAAGRDGAEAAGLGPCLSAAVLSGASRGRPCQGTRCAGDTGAAAEPLPCHSPGGGPWVRPGQSFPELPEGEWEKQLITAGGVPVRVGGPPGLPCSGLPSLSAQLESRFLEFSPASVTDSRLRKH